MNKTSCILLLLAITLVIGYIYHDRRRKIKSNGTTAQPLVNLNKSMFTSTASGQSSGTPPFTATPNSLLSTDANGNMSVISPSVVVPPDYTSNGAFYNSVNVGNTSTNYWPSVAVVNSAGSGRIGLALYRGDYSNSASPGDTTIRSDPSAPIAGVASSGGSLYLQSGSGSAAIGISPSNNITLNNTVTMTGTASVAGDINMSGQSIGARLAALEAGLNAVTSRVSTIVDQGKLQLGPNLALSSLNNAGNEFRITQSNNHGAYIGMAGFGGSS
jgi:hypothetical protein